MTMTDPISPVDVMRKAIAALEPIVEIAGDYETRGDNDWVDPLVSLGDLRRARSAHALLMEAVARTPQPPLNHFWESGPDGKLVRVELSGTDPEARAKLVARLRFDARAWRSSPTMTSERTAAIEDEAADTIAKDGERLAELEALGRGDVRVREVKLMEAESERDALASQVAGLRSALERISKYDPGRVMNDGPCQYYIYMASGCKEIARAALASPDSTGETAATAHPAQGEGEWEPTFRHKKRGSEYMIVGNAFLQTHRPLTDMTPMVVYRSQDGSLWVRSGLEFYDGRFEAIEPARALAQPAQQEGKK